MRTRNRNSHMRPLPDRKPFARSPHTSGYMVALSDDGNRALDLASELPNPGPTGRRQYKNCDPAPGQILLIAEVGVGSDQQLVGRSHEVVIK